MEQHIIELLAALGISLGVYKYLLIFILAIVEGPIIMVVSGFLVKVGYFEFLPAYVSLLLGDWVGDFFWYGLGYFSGKKIFMKHGKYLGLTEERIDRVEELFRRHQNKVMFISKITMGFGLALVTLISCGIMKISLKKFAIFNLIGEFVLAGILIGIGYALANGYVYVNHGFKILYIFAWFVIVFAALYGFSRFIRNKFFGKEL
jgi:membrane protein DedA with SNARE-associated domain